ncbi:MULTISPECIES: hypothetical protein [Vibrio]|uniref:Uncharacterized protein n=1 Tax=Vibrio tasmaniensis TaxID=212663 RepID=A0A2N7NCV3_9VIBR|nr:hypothetical protein [Vibrio tasmaniensis]PMO89850.1 hypothetical protein BCT01_00795 [Vibrio tasmaniensis]PMP09978.1 hypothetical protein BCS92_02295 [Vibrio tasmaniensis]TKG32639.1 hypothetical protein FC057_12550 [Vibrio tasmaniensis]TKG41677.1 hypothetical protein FC063_07390 [Vibrio tasmaniensis]TKG52032.1 hypothetical protein FC070_09660 [Vibrio tasmaniensis]
MNTVSLIAIYKDSIEKAVENNSLELCSTHFLGKLPSTGITFFPSVASFQHYTSNIMTTKPMHLITTNYVGNQVDAALRVHSIDDLKKASILDLAKASQDLKLLIALFLDALFETGEHAELVNELHKKGFIKFTYGGEKIFTRRSALLQVLGHAPQLIDRLRDIPELSHIDAIKFVGYEKNIPVDLITVFADGNLIYQDESHSALVASVTKAPHVSLTVPSLIKTAEPKISLELLKAQVNQSKKVNAA